MLSQNSRSSERPTITCIVPAFNCERFIGAAIESVLSQSRPPDQIIVVDDGSTDRTAQIAGEFAKHVVLIQQPNRGPGSARNTGIGLATGSLIAFQDADDLWEKQKLDVQIDVLEQNPRAALCICLVENFWEDELKQESDAVQGSRYSKPMPGYVFQAMLARRTVFQSVGLIDESLAIAEDAEWFDRVRANGCEIAVADHTLVRRRNHLGNMSRTITQSETSRDSMLEVVRRNLARKRLGGDTT